MDTQREIKFRAWDKKNKRMANVFFIASLSGLPFLTTRSNPIEIMPIISEFILMQYTGLKDKNGKEIYEGDILKRPYSINNGVVDFYPDGYWEVVCEKEDWNYGFDCNEINKHEVIGNKFENKNLI